MSGLAASPPPPKRMAADEFIAWATEQPEGQRYELIGGAVFRMAPERAAHARVKRRLVRMLDEAIERGRLPCEVFPDGVAVRAAGDAVYEPDAFVRCGPRIPGDTVVATDPVVVVEVLSPSTGAKDLGAKLGDYLAMPSVRHYLILDAAHRRAIHHERAEDGGIATRILARGGTLVFEPPGLSLDVATLFGDLDGPAPGGGDPAP